MSNLKLSKHGEKLIKLYENDPPPMKWSTLIYRKQEDPSWE